MNQVDRSATGLLALTASLIVMTLTLLGCPQNMPTDAGGNGNQNQNDNAAPGQPLPTDGLTLDITIEGQGTVEQSGSGDIVTLLAVAEPGWRFDGWSGTTTSAANPLILSPSDTTNLTARFVPDPNQLDSDGDGFVDAVDACPSSPAGANVNADGCATSEIDSDEDGVTDDLDLCPGTAFGVVTDSDGCTPDQRDSDGDGVTDNVDRCPDTPAEESIDTNGCGASQRDDDGDEVNNNLDECPDTPANTPVDATGCPRCGNGIVEPDVGEECDPTDPNDATCDDKCKIIRPGNDACGSPITVTDGGTNFDNRLATPTDTADDDDCGGVFTDLWYCYTATCRGLATISLCDSDFDTTLALYAGCSCPTEDPILCATEDQCGSGGGDEAKLSVTSGATTLIRIGGFNGLAGTGTLSISCDENACLVNADCDDGFFCNGTESCVSGTCQSAASSCIDAAHCDESADRCLECLSGAECDDADMCTVDACVGGTCIHTAKDCADSDPCTVDSCDASTGDCANTPLDCDDGLFCTGLETCNNGVCESSGDPCPANETCDEDADRCIECSLDGDCDDGSFCNGAETCVDGVCVAGTMVNCDDGIACTDDACNESIGSCDNIPNDANCDDGLFCNGLETCDLSSGCLAGADPCDASAGQLCNETTDSCVECLSAADCDDGDPCTFNSCDAFGTGMCNFPQNNNDADLDGTRDCEDGCPNDASKTDPGVCGCGVPDVDTDGDSVLDCLDGCPNDGTKTDPGVCGCGVPDVDTDGDSVLDCLDGCPNDGTKTDPGVCGCGVPEVDTDMDNVIDCIDNCPGVSNPTQADGDSDGVGDACDACPTEGGSNVDAQGCPIPPSWFSTTVLASGLSGYVAPETYTVGLADGILDSAQLGLTEASLQSGLGAVVDSLTPVVPLGVQTEVFRVTIGGSIVLVDKVTITTFSLSFSGARNENATWTFDYTFTRTVEDPLFPDETSLQFVGSQTGSVSTDGLVITWNAVDPTSTVTRCTAFGCSPTPLQDGVNWTLGSWTFQP